MKGYGSFKEYGTMEKKYIIENVRVFGGKMKQFLTRSEHIVVRFYIEAKKSIAEIKAVIARMLRRGVRR